MESLAQLESKAKVPVSARERATAYGEKIRKEMKAKPQATRSPGHAAAKSTKPIDVKSSRLTSAAPPPSAAATQRVEGVGYGAHFDYSTPEAAYSIAIDPITRKGPMSIDSKLFTKADSYTKLGAPRNQTQFWQLWEEKHPGTLSAKNLRRIKDGRVPEVDSHWIEYFPEHQRYMRQKLEHHHIDHGFLVMPLPEKLHRGLGNSSKWHQ
ncbi:MAG: hypothetical protein JSR85_08425 [Proteobacteria bacterium]|nr:hypothetical protein [Pseudomonadota bacterium]